MTQINVKNGHAEETFFFANNPNLRYICADNNQTTDIQNSIFDKNYISIFTQSSSTPIVFLLFYLNDVTFTCSSALIGNTQTTAAKSFAGIYFNTFTQYILDQNC